ncbi:MAG: hypothetical protein K2X78_11230 [Burkholderiaceae bacterium]|nr:hypothetical protein [Burkholderiaceae bacterium]
MPHLHTQPFTTYLAWSFTDVLEGTFKRMKQDYKHHDYPILAPLPANRVRQIPLEGDDLAGPFIYFIVDQTGEVQYIGKSKEKNVLLRWSRPGYGGPVKRYWTHSVRSGGCVFNIAAGLQSGKGPFHLRFAALSELRGRCSATLGIDPDFSEKDALEKAERSLIAALKPRWNGGSKGGAR